MAEHLDLEAKERLHLVEGEDRYHAFTASEHVSRYAAVHSICKGRRVLDVACGEGYGSKLIETWGAQRVLGIDLSNEAVAIAKKLYGTDSVDFRVGDVQKLSECLNGDVDFDLVVSFETIEHLPEPELFLQQLLHFLKAGAMVVLSCPNEDATHDPDLKNPHHDRRYSFESFRSLTEKYLGPAQWLVGAPVSGHANILLGNSQAFEGHTDPGALATQVELGLAMLGPSQDQIEISAQSCTYYLGVWGGTIEQSASVAAQTPSSFVSPWRQLAEISEALKEHIAAHHTQKEENAKTISTLTTRVSFLDGELHLQRQKAQYYAKDLAKTREELTKLQNWKSTLLRASSDNSELMAGNLQAFADSRFYRLWAKSPSMYEKKPVRILIRLCRAFYRRDRRR
ncbi:class I SAM-dependent methyltransferase [Labrys portucalensis]|uniref:Class I SAM-dependent methyltransferase n=2 Tax=Labrys TaxID=204476 RepID=A0ABV6ZRR8_9HYPH